MPRSAFGLAASLARPLAGLLLLAPLGACSGGDGGGGPVTPPDVDAGPPSDDCRSVRLTRYEPFARGYCEFDTDYAFLPRFVRDGMTAAIAEPWVVGARRGDPGEACGECWEIDTVNGTQTVMITDLCPNAGNPLCQGGHFHIDLATPAADAVGGGYLDEGSARPVPCPVEGNVHVLVNDENYAYLRLAFLNHAAPIRAVEYRAVGGGLGEEEPWTPLGRSGGAWEATGSMPLDRGGDGVVFRLTGADGQVVTSTTVVPTHPERGRTFDLGVQLEARAATGGACEFVPPGDAYVDGFGGIDEVRWYLNPWGAAESGFFGEVTDGCFGDTGSCLRVARFEPGSGLHLAYRQAFPTTTFTRLRLRLRTEGGAGRVGLAPSHEGARCAMTFADVGPEWSEVVLELGPLCAELSQLNAVTMDSAGDGVSLRIDDVRFE